MVKYYITKNVINSELLYIKSYMSGVLRFLMLVSKEKRERYLIVM
jgi:uncharacterized membrane protein